MTQLNPIHVYAARRDAEAFASIVNQYQRLVFATCRRKLHDPADLDDAVQETFLRLAQQASKLRSHVGGWLHRCAVNVAIDLNRRGATRKRYETAAATGHAERVDDPQQTLVELREHLDSALEKLDAEQRELIVQRYFVGRAQVELAAEAGVSPSAMTHRLERAIEALRGHLQSTGCATIAAGGTAFVGAALEAESASAAVPTALTANVMKIGLSGAPVQTAGLTLGAIFSSLAFKIGMGAIASIFFAASVWLAVSGPSTAPTSQPVAAAPPPATGPAAFTVNAVADDQQVAQPPRWQTTQPAAQQAVLAGRILDRDGKPVSNATVTLNGPAALRATTDADGNYAFNTIQRDGEYRVGVQAEGYVSNEPYDARTPGVQLSAQSQARRDLVIERGVPVIVTVMSGTGQPLRNANVDANMRGSERGGGLRRIRTDDLGQARFVLPKSANSYVIAVTLEEYAPAHALVTPSAIDQPQEALIVLTPGISVAGIAICSDGKPATGWEIYAKPDWWSSNYVPRGAPIDKDGNFTLTNISPGNYSLHISKRTATGGTSYQVASAMLPPEQSPLRVNVPEPSPSSQIPFTGRVRVIGGRPDYVMVSGHSTSGGRQYLNTQISFGSARRGGRAANGPALGANEAEFTFEAMAPGTYQLQFDSPQIETKVVENVQVPGELPIVELKFADKPRLAGVVTNAASGEPITHFALRLRKIRTIGRGPNYTPDVRWTQVSNPQGRFDVELVGPGVYQVQISAEGYAWAWSSESSAESGASKPELKLKLSTGGSLSGEVRDPGGKPLAGAKVIPLSMARSASMRSEDRFASEAGAVQTGADGRFTIERLSAGDEAIKIVHADFAPTIVTKLKVIEGQKSDVGSVSVRVGGSAEGIVYDRQGNPSAGEVLNFQDDSGYGGGDDEMAGRVATVTTDAAGHFRVDHLREQVLFVNRDKAWEKQGVTRRTMRPVDGKTAQLDFGGQKMVKGRLLAGTSPIVGRRIQFTLRSPHFGPVTVIEMTDNEGRFTFRGVPSGKYTLYSEADGNRGEWLTIRQDVSITGQDMDLGDVTQDAGDVIITLTADDPADLAGAQRMNISTNVIGQIYQQHVTTVIPDGSPGKWRAKGVPAGEFRVRVSPPGSNTVVVYVSFERKSGTHEMPVAIHIPRSTATLNARVTPSGDSNSAQYVILLCEAENPKTPKIEAYVMAEGQQSIKLPVGIYKALDFWRAQPRNDIPPVILKEAETTAFEMSLADQALKAATGISLTVWTAEGVLIPGAMPRVVDAEGRVVSSNGDTSSGTLFILPFGKYRAMFDRPGAQPAVKEIEISEQTAPLSTRSRWLPIDLLVE